MTDQPENRDAHSETPHPAPPGLFRRARNLAKAVGRQIRYGPKRVTPEVRDQRLAICQRCPSCDREKMICTEPECGCNLEFKTWWATEACPLNKWSGPA